MNTKYIRDLNVKAETVYSGKKISVTEVLRLLR